MEWLLGETIEAAKRSGTIEATSLSTVVVDTTVQPKAIAHPTDSRLLNRAREQLVDEAKAHGVELRQSYARVGRRAEQQAGRYAHARQFRRMRGQPRKLRGWLGRGIRDVALASAGRSRVPDGHGHTRSRPGRVARAQRGLVR